MIDPTNAGKTGPRGMRLAEVDTTKDMRVFDQLPKRVRAFLRDAPVNISAGHVRDLLQFRHPVIVINHLKAML